jgi:hypothetical protein
LGSKAAQEAALAFLRALMRTNFYIDAFNLYYGCLKNTTQKWLNLEEFCRRSFPPQLADPLGTIHKPPTW